MKKRLMIVALAAVMTFGFCACGNGNANDSEKNTQADSQKQNSEDKDTESEEPDDGKVVYKVTVVDENQEPILNAMVQLCKDSCLPGSTGTTGTAEFSLPEDDYKVSFMSLPQGYTYSTEETEFYFEDGKTEMTIVLKAAE